jgi:hypothetical protein
MCFDELFDRKCEVKVCDIIQLFLAGYDDKIYLNLSDTDEKLYFIQRAYNIV